MPHPNKGRNLASVEKTKTGHEWRVRGPKGKVYGEFETKRRARMKEQSVAKRAEQMLMDASQQYNSSKFKYRK